MEKMSDRELRKRYLSLFQSIYVSQCYSSSDVVEFIQVEDELLRRGYTVREGMPRIRKTRDSGISFTNIVRK